MESVFDGVWVPQDPFEHTALISVGVTRPLLQDHFHELSHYRMWRVIR